MSRVFTSDPPVLSSCGPKGPTIFVSNLPHVVSFYLGPNLLHGLSKSFQQIFSSWDLQHSLVTPDLGLCTENTTLPAFYKSKYLEMRSRYGDEAPVYDGSKYEELSLQFTPVKGPTFDNF